MPIVTKYVPQAPITARPGALRVSLHVRVALTAVDIVSTLRSRCRCKHHPCAVSSARTSAELYGVPIGFGQLSWILSIVHMSRRGRPTGAINRICLLNFAATAVANVRGQYSQVQPSPPKLLSTPCHAGGHRTGTR